MQHKKSADVNKIPLFGQIYRLCRHKRSSTSTHPDTAWTIWSWWRRWKVFYGYWHVAKASNGMIIRLYIKCPFPTKCQHGIYFIIWDDEMSVYFEMTWFTFSCAQRLRFYHCRNLIGDRISIFGLSINLFFVFRKNWSDCCCFFQQDLTSTSLPWKVLSFINFFLCRMEKFSSSVKLQSGRLWAIFAAVISCIRAKSCTKFAFKLNITFSKHTLSS